MSEQRESAEATAVQGNAVSYTIAAPEVAQGHAALPGRWDMDGRRGYALVTGSRIECAGGCVASASCGCIAPEEWARRM